VSKNVVIKSAVAACRVAHTARSILLLCLLVLFLLPACKTRESSAERAQCPATPTVWAKPPEDPAIPGPLGYGHYLVNADRSIWAAAWWQDKPGLLRAGGDGVKVGWFRPAGAALEVVGQRLDDVAPSLVARVPCCYPTRFQASGLLFPSAGCWRVTATAADSSLSFIVRVGEVAQQPRSGA
jgi:hypothetical protein